MDLLEFVQDGQYGELAYMAPWFEPPESLAKRIEVVQGEMRRIITRVDNAKRRGAFWDSAPLLKVLNEPDAAWEGSPTFCPTSPWPTSTG